MSESRIRKSPTLGAFNAAMAKVQAEVEDPFKASENSHFNSSYADLAMTIKNNRRIAAKHGICILQFPFADGGVAGSTVYIGHESGEWMEGDLALPMQKVTCQGGGSAVTYSRRYQVQGILNIAPTSEQMRAAPEPLPVEPERIHDFDPGDDDGETAEGRGVDPQTLNDEAERNEFIAEKVQRMRDFTDEKELRAWADKLVGEIHDPITRKALARNYKAVLSTIRRHRSAGQ